MATDTADKTRENRLRAAARRQGFELVKSRQRDPRALGYGKYMIVSLAANAVEAGGLGDGFQMSLDDVEKWLTARPGSPERRVT